MKLSSKFSLISAVAAGMMLILVLCTVIGVNVIQEFKNYQSLQQTVQIGLTDITNYLNRTVSWAIEPETIGDDWTKKIVTLNKQFHQLNDSKITKFLPEDVNDKLTDVSGGWTKLVSRLNPFNSQYKAMQSINFTDAEKSSIRRNGITTTYNRNPDSETLKECYGQQLLIHIQMKDIMGDEASLSKLLTELNTMLIIQIKSYTAKYYIFVVSLSFIFAVILFLYIKINTGRITKHITTVQNFTSSLAEKDFTSELSPHGSNEMIALMQNINGMVNELNNFFIIVKKTAARAISSGYSINDSATSTAAATEEIDRNVDSITEEFEQINNSVHKVVDAVNDISYQVKTLVDDNQVQTHAIDDSTSAVNTMSATLEEIRQSAEHRTRRVEEMTKLVEDGDSKINATAQTLEDVMGKLDEIQAISTMINSISHQTNLLSMNAAIEAAHAGEYGRGFSVVAEEIRQLAESTAKNAKQIGESIKLIIQKVTEANDTSISAREAFSKVSEHSEKVIQSFREITKGIRDVNEQTKQITQKTEVTAQTASKINNYCSNLASSQETIAAEINSVSRLFNDAMKEIHEIQQGTEEVVDRMSAVGDLSKESYKNMTALENVLEEFKTSVDNSEEVRNEMEASEIENVISPELQAQLESDFEAEGLDDLDDQIDSAEEMIVSTENQDEELSEDSAAEDEEIKPET